MIERPLYLEFPSSLTIKKFLNKLGKSQDFEIVSQQYTIKTFYDSFDWRLYGAGISCELRQSKLCSELLLTNNKTSELVARLETEDVPQFYQQFTDITFAQQYF